MIEVDLTAHQAMGQCGDNWEVSAKQMGVTVLVGATNEDQVPRSGACRSIWKSLGQARRGEAYSRRPGGYVPGGQLI